MNKKFYEKTWFIVLILILFFPIGLVLVWTNKHWTQKGKIIATVIVAVILLFGLLGGGESDTTTTSTTVDTTVETTVDTTVETTVDTTNETTAETTSETIIEDTADDPVKAIENTIRARIEEKYTSTDIEKIDINEDLGTDTPDDYVALVYLTWNMQNTGKTSKEVLTMYSNDLAATTAEQLQNVQEIAIFWDVPYLNDSAKCAYERKGNDMYISDMIWGKAFSE